MSDVVARITKRLNREHGMTPSYDRWLMAEAKAEIAQLRAAVLFFSQHYHGPSDNMLCERERELFQMPELLQGNGGE